MARPEVQVEQGARVVIRTRTEEQAEPQRMGLTPPDQRVPMVPSRPSLPHQATTAVEAEEARTRTTARCEAR